MQQPALQAPPDFIPFEKEAINRSMTARFEEIVQKYPAAIAVRSGDEQLTYQELNAMANRLARAIVYERGTQPEPIAFILEHGAPAIIAILAIMKAGKAYVPVDPFYPPGWITHILDDTGSGLVLTNNRNLPITMTSLENPRTAEVINLDTLDAKLPDGDLGLEISPSDMAYILYTSGSTGMPKGAIHTHQDALHNNIAQTNDLWITPSDRSALFISIGFEAARFGLYIALLNGGTLCMYDIRTRGLAGLCDWIYHERITILLTTPSTFRHMFNLAPENMRFPAVRVIVMGGESVTSQDVLLFQKHFSINSLLVNVLGMTETGVIARFKLRYQETMDGHSLPAGYPIGDKSLLILDEAGQPVQPGEVGEILIKSQYLSPGYWRQPGLTAEKFSSETNDSRMRIFRTGDLGRLRPDGSLEYLGRKDSQIKIRGYRVDVAQVEAVIHQYSGVKNVVVIAQASRVSQGEKLLVAYIEQGSAATLDKKELRRFLAGKLPDYMVPPMIVFLDSLPLTPTGKIDRRGLPDPEEVGQGQTRTYIAPRDAIETQLVKIWERVLRTKPIGIQDDYFELGGNSLLAAQLFQQIEKIFAKKLPLATLFQAPTVEQQADILRQGDSWQPDWSSLVALRAQGHRPPLFFAAPVGGNVLSYRDLILRLEPDQPCYGLQALGLDGIQTVHRNVPEIANHYVSEIRKLQPEGPYYLCGSSFGGLVAYEMAQQLHDAGQPVAVVAMFDAYGPNYPKRLPSTSRVRRKIFKYLRRLDTHLSNLRYTNWQGRMIYLRVKGQKFIARLSRRIRRKIDQVLQPMPRELKQIRATHMGAAKRKKGYLREKRRFGGRLVLFRAEKQPLGIYPDPKLGWGAVVGDEIEVYEIPGHHTSLIYEPRVNVLAEKLDQILSESQTRKNKTSL